MRGGRGLVSSSDSGSPAELGITPGSYRSPGMRLLVVSVVVAFTSPGYGCGNQGGNDPPERPAARAEATPDCRKAPKALLTAVQTGMGDMRGAVLRNGYVDRSNDFADLYMVAAEIRAAGLDPGDDVGVWATHTPAGDSAIYAVDGVARRFTDWPVAGKVHTGADSSADGVKRVRRCVAGT